MKRISLLILTGLIIVPLLSYSQSNRWKRTRYELTGALGVTSIMSDLGGGDKSSHFVSDFNFLSQRPLLNAGMRYKVLEPLAVKASLSFGWLSADDAISKNIYRQDRNLSFRSPLVELSTQVEYSIIKEPVSHRYSLRRRRRFSLKNFRINTYVFAGIAGFWFNPKGKDDGPEGTGKWVALQPLGTEGQGLMEGREKYSRIQLAIPLGIGMKYNISRQISLGVEFGARYTFTDYIDDVSTTYIDHQWLSNVDPLAARMADKSLWSKNPLPGDPLIPYEAGGQRGESRYNDFYFFSLVTVAYKLNTGRNGLPKF
ncbi:MAG: DUF6089 family protein [Salinivirgaceae bacterium]|jgi:hypothetical protein|nr:DUF6089 family protein [Salinivirgaceae bacterium]